MKKALFLIGLLLIVSVSATSYFSYRFDSDITLICPDCDYWISCETNSMYPTFGCNDTLIASEPSSKKDIKIGDIIWFHGTKEQLSIYENPDVKYITHRVIGIDYKRCYITKGDNNNHRDNYTPCYYDVIYRIKGVIYED